MIDVIIHHQHGVDTIKAEKNVSLLQGLRDNEHEIYAPCGGKGTCEKCKV